MRIRLSIRFVITIILLGAVMLALMSWNSVRIINSGHVKVVQSAIHEEAAILADSLVPALAAVDRAIILDRLSLLQKNHNIIYAAVLDRNGNKLAQIGMLDENGLTAVHDKDIEQEILDGKFSITQDVQLAGQKLGSLYINYSLDELNEIASATRVQNTIIAIIALVLLVSITLASGFYFMRRLRSLEIGAQMLSSGKLKYRIPIHGNDEITDVEKSFNLMAGNLSEMQMALYKEHNALERESSHLQTILNGVDAVVLEANPETCQFSYISKEATNLLGYDIKDWFQVDFWRSHLHPDDLDLFNKKIARHKDAGSTFTLDYRLRNSSDEYIWVRSINNIETNEYAKPILRGLLIDIDEQKSAESKIIYLAEHDALTGLLNRRRFQEEMNKSIAFAERFNHQSALLFIDLDQFKYINDSLGHQGGDEYLIAVSKCLKKAIRKVDVLGRLGGDEFGIIIPNVNEEEVAQISHKLLKTLSEEVLISQGLLTHISASIGATMFPAHGTITSELLAKADAAMYAIKGQGRNGFHMYMDQDRELLAMQEKIHWEDRIKRALKDDLFLFHYQPIIEMGTREITHYEVLLRMYDKENDQLIMPGAFLDTAERFGLIKDIDLWVLENAIRTLGEQSSDENAIKLAVNISGRNFGNKGLLKDMEKWLKEYQANPENLIFEVTETAAVDNLAQARDFIESLRVLGCKFALDDFGVGFSTLHYLKHLPVDYIKIDGSFVRNLHVEPRDRIFIKAICDIADGLGIYTIAEFVENEAIDKILTDLGVDQGQGFYYGKPLASFGPCIASIEEKNISIGS